MPFIRKDGHLAKAFQKEKHDTASQLLTEYANGNWSRRWLNLFWKKWWIWLNFGRGRSLFSSVASRGLGISACVTGA